MYDVAIIGAGIAGASFASRISKSAKTLLIEAQDFEEGIPERTNIFAEHNKPFVEKDLWNDNNIFTRPFLQLNYKSENHDGLLNSSEFGDPLGKICHTEVFIEQLLKNAEDHDGDLRFNERLKRVNRKSDHLELITDKGETLETKVLALATGSRGFKIQKSLGFQVPDSFSGIYTNIQANQGILDENFSFQYMFHINPKISTNGPFFFNVGKGRVSTGYLGNTNAPDILKDKLDRILKNYKKIQGYMKGLSWDPKSFITGSISKHPIKTFTKDRILVLGEAAGLVTAYFYEGILCGLVSAVAATKTLESLLEKESSFTRTDLMSYEREISHVLRNYWRNGDACEILFYESGSSVKTVWDTYTNLLNSNKTVRAYLYEAMVNQDLSKHDNDKDRYVGERLLGALPAISKLTMIPKFFKALRIGHAF